MYLPLQPFRIDDLNRDRKNSSKVDLLKLAFLAGDSSQAKDAVRKLTNQFGNCDPNSADVIVALGGDGFMLQTQHEFMNTDIPVYGMNKGKVGFLMNEYHEDGLEERIVKAVSNRIHPLKMTATDSDGKKHTARAINEVSLLRQSYQAASLQISIDGKIRLPALICDGVLIATPAGSTAYNLSAHGPILPINSPLLALTPVSPFRPRRWRGALIPNSSQVEILVNETDKRPVNAVADHTEIKSVRKVDIHEDRKSTGVLLFDREHSWDERILAEQFQY
jgi:NAD+ kinase